MAAAAPLAGMAIPGARSMSSKSIVAFCGPGPLNGPPCANQIPPHRNAMVLSFQASASSLVCDVRSATAAPFCPTLPAGSGTTPLEAFGSDFTVTATWSAPAGQSITVADPGERLFLALAFDMLAPLHYGVSVTYSPDPLANPTLFSTDDLICENDNGLSVVCGSTQPSLAVRINNPVPAPLGWGGVSTLLWQARRLRRRTGARS